MRRLSTRAVVWWGVALALAPHTAGAGALNPADFISLGPLNINGGSYTINTSTDTFTGPDGFSVTGVNDDGVSVFDFSGITIHGASISTTGSDPLAILSQGDISFTASSLNLSGQSGGGAYDASGGPGGYAGGFDASGPGAGGTGGVAGGGGGFGGRGGDGGGGSGGGTYGDLAVQLQGGSGGGHGGGGGGGAVELGAIGSITIDDGATILATGGAGGDYGGGGAGGGIFVHADSVSLAGVDALNVSGGDGDLAAGGGGGGRILIVAGSYIPPDPGVFGLAGGAGGADGGDSGSNGTLTVDLSAVPEPSALAMLTALLPMAGAYAGWRRATG